MIYRINKQTTNRQTTFGKTKIYVCSGQFPHYKNAHLLLSLDKYIRENASKYTHNTSTLSFSKGEFAQFMYLENKELTPKRINQLKKQIAELEKFTFSYQEQGKTFTTCILSNFNYDQATKTFTLDITQEYASFVKNNEIYVPKNVMQLSGKHIAMYVFFNKHNGHMSYSIDHLRNHLGFTECDKRVFLDVKKHLDDLIETTKFNGKNVIDHVVYKDDLTIQVYTKKNQSGQSKSGKDFNTKLIKSTELIQKNSNESTERPLNIGISLNGQITQTVEDIVKLAEGKKINIHTLYDLIKKNRKQILKNNVIKAENTVRNWFKRRPAVLLDFDFEFDSVPNVRDTIENEVAEKEKEIQQYDAECSNEKTDVNTGADFDDSLPF